ncbi:hypothetical protein [Marinoscillum sp. MHG1-6]|uniref:hypothetical protein n=1 Tax=Marinoscillum sp. MHG1-6 TaxID=2959627 RepID=UPI00215783D7|nr:hypothetical protein [Marinoscillum sp. MHG1-6]
MYFKIYLATLLIVVLTTVNAQDKWTSGRPDGHAPISVMGDHTHGKGDWMISYRFMHMHMDGLRNKTSDLSADVVFDNYMMAPKEMHMHMHMLGLMYAVSNNLTFMAMGNYLEQHMHVSMMNMMAGTHEHFESASAGLGDVKIFGLWKFLDTKGQRIHANIGVSIPVGSIDNSAVTPMSEPNATQLPYPMQIGSGTWDALPGMTYMGQKENLSWGAQTYATIRIGENDHGYSLSNKGNLLGWIGYRTTEWLSFSAKINGMLSGKISGSDPAYMNPMMSPTLDPKNFGGETLTGSLGFNIYIPRGAFKNVRLGLEYELPMYQNLNGPQMKTKEIGTFGLQYSW